MADAGQFSSAAIHRQRRRMRQKSKLPQGARFLRNHKRAGPVTLARASADGVREDQPWDGARTCSTASQHHGTGARRRSQAYAWLQEPSATTSGARDSTLHRRRVPVRHLFRRAR